MAAGHHTGLPGLVLEDIALCESAGRQLNRARETLNVTDAFVMRYRRRLLAAIKAHEEGAPQAVIYFGKVRALDGFVPKGRIGATCRAFPGKRNYSSSTLPMHRRQADVPPAATDPI